MKTILFYSFVIYITVVNQDQAVKVLASSLREIYLDSITQSGLEQALSAPLVVLNFWANWSAASKTMASIMGVAVVAHPRIRFYKIDADTEDGLVGAYQVRELPALVGLRDGKAAFFIGGAIPSEQVEALMRQLENI